MNPRHAHRLGEPEPDDWKELLLASVVLVLWFVVLVYGLPLIGMALDWFDRL